MNNVKSIFSNISLEFRNLIKKFPVTFIAIVFTAICNIILIEGVNDADNVFVLGILLICACFFSESLFKKALYKVISILLTAGISLILTFVLEISESYNYIIGYVLLLVAMTIYKIIKNNKIDFNKYLLKVFSNIFYSGIIYLVLAIGIGLITIIFAELILETYASRIILDIQVILFWLFLATSVINGITNIEGKNSTTFISKLVEYVLLPLILIAMLIIYTYIFKIIVLWQIPSNMIFRILAIMFMFAFPIWNMAEAIENKNKILEKIIKILPYLYIPFVLLEIYSISVRIGQFGVTPVRYLGMAFLILQIIALLLNYINKKKTAIILICVAVLSIIVFISPINLEKASILSQKLILKNTIKEETNFNSLSDGEKEKVRSSYMYLKIESPEDIPNYLQEQKESIVSFKMQDELYGEEHKNIYYSNEIDEINIEGYKKVIQIYSSSRGTELNSLNLNSENSNEIVENINLESTINDFINENNDNLNVDEYITNSNPVKINEESALYITKMTINYSTNNKVDFISLYGLLLKK